MVKFNWGELVNEEPPYLARELAKGARTLVCNIWNKYPDQWTKGNDLTSPVKFFWNKVCEPEGINKQPSPPPFSGGQCHKSYYAQVTVSANNGIVETRTVGVIWGKIKRFAIEDFPNDSQFVSYGGTSSNPDVESRSVWLRTGSGNMRYVSYTINSVYTSDGSLDNCGSLPGKFPTTPLPSPGQETHVTNINDGGDTDLTVPLGWFDIDFSVPIKLEFSVGEIIVDVGGITINFNNENEWQIEETPDVADLPEETKNIINRTFDNSQDILDTIEEDRKPFSEDIYLPTQGDETTSEDVTDPEIEFVKITVVKFPVENKTILNENVQDTFFWAGYFCWTVEEARTTHVVIQKTNNIYRKPSWATGYAIFAVNGAKLQITTFKKKVQPET